MGLAPARRWVMHMGYGTSVVTLPTTWELIGDMLPEPWWLDHLAANGWAPVWGGWVQDTQWQPHLVLVV